MYFEYELMNIRCVSDVSWFLSDMIYRLQKPICLKQVRQTRLFSANVYFLISLLSTQITFLWYSHNGVYKYTIPVNKILTHIVNIIVVTSQYYFSSFIFMLIYKI